LDLRETKKERKKERKLLEAEEDSVRRSFIISTLHKMKGDEMGGTCNTHEMRNSCKILIGKPKGENH
jgi:hypothetical protein